MGYSRTTHTTRNVGSIFNIRMFQQKVRYWVILENRKTYTTKNIGSIFNIIMFQEEVRQRVILDQFAQLKILIASITQQSILMESMTIGHSRSTYINIRVFKRIFLKILD